MISITSQPAAGSLQAAYLPVKYSILQTGESGDLPPAIVVTPSASGTGQPSFPAGPDRGGSTFQYFFDLSGVAARRFAPSDSLPSVAAPTLRVLPGAVVELSALFAEYAPNQSGLIAATGVERSSVSCYVINAYRRADDADPTINAYGRYDRPAFLTRRPRIVALGINDRDVMCLFNAAYSGSDLSTSSGSLTAQFKFYNAAGLVRTESITLPGGGGTIAQLPYAPGDIEPLGLGSLDGITYYSVTAGRGAAATGDGGDGDGAGSSDLSVTGDTMTVSIERGASDPLAVYYYNSFGVWERALFHEPAIQQYGLSGSQYTRQGRTVAEQRRSRWAVQITSSTRTADEADALLDLANAVNIYAAPGGRLLPVNIDASTLPVAFGPGSNGQQPFQFTLRAAMETRSQNGAA